MCTFDQRGKIVHAHRDGWLAIYDISSMEIFDLVAVIPLINRLLIVHPVQLPIGLKISGLALELDYLVIYLASGCPLIYKLSDSQPLTRFSVRDALEAIQHYVRELDLKADLVETYAEGEECRRWICVEEGICIEAASEIETSIACSR